MSNKTFYTTDIEKLEVGEAPMPKIGADDVLIKVRSVGICGSDLHYYREGAIGDFKVGFHSRGTRPRASWERWARTLRR